MTTQQDAERAVATLADAACAYTCASLGAAPAAVDANISFLRAAQLGQTVTAKGEVIRMGSRMGHFDVAIESVEGEALARFRGSCVNRGPLSGAARPEGVICSRFWSDAGHATAGVSSVPAPAA